MKRTPFGEETTIALTIGDTQPVFDEFTVTYSSYSHEHASSSPDEPFAATIGVCVLLIAAGDARESMTLYFDAVRKVSEPISWSDYSITLIDSSADQQKVWLKIARAKRR